MRAHFPQIGVVADVVAGAVLVHVGEDLGLAGEFFDDLESLEDRGAVRLTAAEVVNLARARGRDEGRHEARDVERVDVVAHLFALVAENLVFAALEVAFHEVAKKTVELDAGVVRAGEAAAAKRAGGQAEIAAVFLHHHVGGDLAGAEERVFRLVNGEGLGDAVRVGRVGIVPARGELRERDTVGRVAIDLVRAHMHEGRLRARLARGFEQVERADGVGVEVVKGDGGGAVVRGLRGSVDDDGRLHLADKGEDAGAVADVDLVVNEAGHLSSEARLVPARVALRAEEDGALVVVHPVDGVTELAGKIDADLGADEAGGAGDEEGLGHTRPCVVSSCGVASRTSSRSRLWCNRPKS